MIRQRRGFLGWTVGIGVLLITAAAVAPISRLCARANVFMYVAVASPGSNIAFIAITEPSEPAAATAPTTTRWRRLTLMIRNRTTGQTR